MTTKRVQTLHGHGPGPINRGRPAFLHLPGPGPCSTVTVACRQGSSKDPAADPMSHARPCSWLYLQRTANDQLRCPPSPQTGKAASLPKSARLSLVLDVGRLGSADYAMDRLQRNTVDVAMAELPTRRGDRYVEPLRLTPRPAVSGFHILVHRTYSHGYPQAMRQFSHSVSLTPAQPGREWPSLLLHNPKPCEQESGIYTSRCEAGCTVAAQKRGCIAAKINRNQAINVVGLSYHCVPMLWTGLVSRETRACLSPSESGRRPYGICIASGRSGR